MHLHEYQAKDVLTRYGIRSPIGYMTYAPQEAFDAARQIGCERFVLKSQLHMNEREAVGAILFCDSAESVKDHAEHMFGRTIKGKDQAYADQIRGVLVEEAISNHREVFVAVTTDLKTGGLVLIAVPHSERPKAQGGLEPAPAASANTEPSRIRILEIQIENHRARADYASLACDLTDDPVTASNLAELFRSLATAAVALDARLIELSPLAILPDGRLIALDIKLTIDDNALFRQTEMASLRHDNEVNLDQRDDHARELEAQRFNMNYIAMDGSVGVVSNGAGLALATLDAIVDAGGHPANFMDIRTMASSTDIAHGLGLLFTDARIRAILVNVHGGGMQKCDTIAEAIGIATRRQKLRVPLIIRLAGNNAEFAAMVLENNGVMCSLTSSLDEAARIATDAAKHLAA